MERNAAVVHKSLKEQPDTCINILNCSSNKSNDNDIYFLSVSWQTADCLHAVRMSDVSILTRL